MYLAMFDLDGTLIEDHLIDVECPACDGEGVAEPGAGMSDPCPRCKGRRFVLAPREDIPYTETKNLWLEGVSARERIRELANVPGMSFAVCTNQGGVAMGFQTEGEVRQRIASALGGLDWFFGMPFSVHVCFDHPAATVAGYKGVSADRLFRRKPEPGMLVEACQRHGLGVDPLPRRECIFVGDRETDKTAALRGQFAFAPAYDWLRRGNAALGL